MRQFIEKEGKYVINLPIDWYHKNKLYDAKENDPESFEFLEKPVGTFQLSLTDPDKGMIPDIIKKHNIISQEYGKKKLTIVEEIFLMEKYDMYMWFVRVDDNFLIAKYIYDSKNRERQVVKDELSKAKSSLETLIFVDKHIQVAVFERFQFDKFMYSLGGSIELTNKAYKENNPIELVIILANQIDAALRLCLIMKEQIDSKSEKIDIKLIHQKDNDKAIMEKAIYKMALEKEIITESLNTKLYNLYNKRNKVVHRYIISDITTKEVMAIAIEYSILEKEIGKIVVEYEQKQFKEGIGMYGKKEAPNRLLTEEEKILIQNGINEKHSHFAFINKSKE